MDKVFQKRIGFTQIYLAQFIRKTNANIGFFCSTCLPNLGEPETITRTEFHPFEEPDAVPPELTDVMLGFAALHLKEIHRNGLLVNIGAA